MKDWKKSSKETRRGREGEHGTMSQALCRVLRDLVCEEQEEPDCRSDAPESTVTAFELKTGISYSTDKNKPLRSDSSAKTAKPYPQDAEEDEYRYIDAGWLEAVARGLTAGARKHPGETWRQIPAEEHAARAMRHLNLYRAGDRKDSHLINAAMRCIMAYATEKVRGEGQVW